jgi:predicted kinase
VIHRDKSNMEAVIFIGIQASGKSTFFKEKFSDTHVRINLDMLKTRHREKLFLDTCLHAGQRFVVDNTNPTVEDRQRYIIPAKAAGFEVIGYYFASPISSSLQRNRYRVGIQRIPEKAIQAMYRKLQIPACDEGFDRLYYVKIDSQGHFVVEEWQDEV